MIILDSRPHRERHRSRDGAAAVDNRMLTEKNDLAVTDRPRIMLLGGEHQARPLGADPGVGRARDEEKFCARPTAAMSSASSRDDSTLVMRRFISTDGFDCICPPTIPTRSGSSISPTRSPASLVLHRDNEV